MPLPTLDELNRFRIGDELRFSERSAGFPVAEVNNRFATATVALQGAHLMTWAPKGQEPVIWLSGDAKLAPGKSIRGGVPVCWPWFGPHAAEPKFPGHGYARTVPWALVEAGASAQGATRLVFELIESEESRRLWPAATPVRLEMEIGAALTLTLVTRNAGLAEVTIGEALHTYFQVSDLDSMVIEGLDGVTYTDKVDGGARKRQAGAIAIGGEVDRVYVDTAGDCVIADRGYGRRIRIAKSGSRSTVVWNPWSAKAAAMGDLGPDGWRCMVCVESGNALESVVTIAPGSEHRMQVVYSVEGLGA